jgi:hypothetical protein
MKSLSEYAKQLDELLKDIECNRNSHESRIKLPEALAGIQYHYAKSSYRLARWGLIIAVLALVVSCASFVVSLKSPIRRSVSSDSYAR